MSDALVQLGKNKLARRIIGGAGLPIPLPQELARGEGPWEARPLADRPVIMGGQGALTQVVARTLARAGADLVLAAPELEAEATDPAEAWSRPLSVQGGGGHAGEDGDEDTEDTGGLSQRPQALVYDATAVADVAGLRGLYDFFHPRVRELARCGRVVVLSRPAALATSPAEAAAREAVSGFVRSVAKELGRKGSTATWIEVEDGAEDAVEPVLRWLLGPRSAFVTGQPFRVGSGALRRKLGEVPFTRPLEGKVALVTGAAQGIGAAIVARLAEEGAKVVGVDRPEESARLGPVMAAAGGVPVLTDLTSEEAPGAVAEALGRLGGVDIVVHNAGVTRDKTLGRMDEGRWDLTLAVNLQALLRLNEALIPELLHDGGRIVQLASIAGIAGNVGQTNYACSKAGVIGLTRALAADLGRRGITVNAVAPGFIETRLTAAIPVSTREPARRLSSLGQGGLPVDVAELITFLASPGAQGLTGGVHRVCGQHLTGA